MNCWANSSGLSRNVSAFVRAIMYFWNETSRNPTVRFVSVPYFLQPLHTVAALDVMASHFVYLCLLVMGCVLLLCSPNILCFVPSL